MNLLELLQQYQRAQSAPTMLGPVQPQNPQPGFRAPPAMQMAPPRQPDPGFSLGDGIGMMGGFLHGLGNSQVKPGVPTPQGDPTGGAGPAYLGGTSSLGAEPMFVLDPATGQYIPNPKKRGLL